MYMVKCTSNIALDTGASSADAMLPCAVSDCVAVAWVLSPRVHRKFGAICVACCSGAHWFLSARGHLYGRDDLISHDGGWYCAREVAIGTQHLHRSVSGNPELVSRKNDKIRKRRMYCCDFVTRLPNDA